MRDAVAQLLRTAVTAVAMLLGRRPAATRDGCGYCGLSPAVHRWRRLRRRWAYAHYPHPYTAPHPTQLTARDHVRRERTR